MKYSLEEAKRILQGANTLQDASINQGNAGARQSIRKIRIDLTIGRDFSNPLKLGFPYRSLYVASSSDNQAFVELKPFTKDEYQQAIPLRNKDVLDFDLSPNDAFISWPSQPNKFLEIFFFVDASFKAGSQVVAFESTQNSITTGAGVQNNTFPNIHVVRNSFTVTNLAGSSLSWNVVYAANAQNDFSTGWIIPKGFQLVVQNMNIFCQETDLASPNGLVFCFGTLQAGAANFGTALLANLLGVYDKCRIMRASQASSVVFQTALTQMDIPNAFGVQVSGSAPLDTSGGEFVLDADKRLAISIWNEAIGAFGAGAKTFDIEITGYLRAIA